MGSAALWVSGLAEPPDGDEVSPEQAAEIDSKFMVYTGQMDSLPATDPQVRDAVQKAPYLETERTAELLAELEQGDTQLGAITLWDNVDEDGDIVQISTSRATIIVAISHAPQTFLIPRVPGEPIHIVGVKDGSGGITAALSMTSGPVPLPIMAEGQTIVLPMM